MGVILRDSLLCRLCGENSVKGVKLFDDKSKIYVLVNKYLPIKVANDGILPSTICPGCHIHLQDTILFHDLIEKGQKKIDALYVEELKNSTSNNESSLNCENTSPVLNNDSTFENQFDYSNIFNDNKKLVDSIVDFNSETLQQSLTVSDGTNDGDRPCDNNDKTNQPVKRKRGRPKKSEVVQEKKIIEPLERASRTRKQPIRFSESVHGQELENVINFDNESKGDNMTGNDGKETANGEENVDGNEQANEVVYDLKEGIIGWLQSKTGKTLASVTAKKKPNNKGRLCFTRLVCIICSKTLVHKSNLLRHLLQNKCGESDITIDDICPVNIGDVEVNTNSTETELIAPNKKYKHVCMICQKVFQSKCSLVYHEEKFHTYHIYTCSSCGKHFTHRLSLVRHQRSHIESRPYRCDMCSFSFKYLSNLTYHKLSHSNSSRRYVCSFCLSSFNLKRSLEHHIRVHLGYKPFQCEICQKVFSQKNNLQEHMRIHSGEKPFKCNVCDRTFTTSSQLKTHSLIHNEVKPHTCELCKKSFRHKDSWCTHVRRHTGEKPFSCTHCGKCFLEGNGVRKHERLHTGEKRYSCKHCDKLFADCSNLNKHKKKVHGDGLENSLARVIYLNLDLPQELNHLDLGNIDETNTNTISALNLALGDVDTDLHVTASSLEAKTLPIVFNALGEPEIKNKELNITLSDIQNQLDPTNQLTVPIVLKTLGDGVSDKDSVNQLSMFSEDGMPLVLKGLEESNDPGKDMPVLGLENDMGESDTNRNSLNLSLANNQGQIGVVQHEDQDALTLAINPQIQQLKDLTSLVDSSRRIVTDGQGVPIKITMSDGSQLQVTTTDGESLEVMTNDGISLPVRLSTPDIVLTQTLPNIDALSMEGALGELSQLSQGYTIQYVEGHGIKLLSTPGDQPIKLIPSAEDQNLKLLTSAAEAGIDLLSATDAQGINKLLTSSNDKSNIIWTQVTE